MGRAVCTFSLPKNCKTLICTLSDALNRFLVNWLLVSTVLYGDSKSKAVCLSAGSAFFAVFNRLFTCFPPSSSTSILSAAAFVEGGLFLLLNTLLAIFNALLDTPFFFIPAAYSKREAVTPLCS